MLLCRGCVCCCVWVVFVIVCWLCLLFGGFVRYCVGVVLVIVGVVFVVVCGFCYCVGVVFVIVLGLCLL